MRPKKLSTILENLIEEIDSVYSEYIQTRKELDLKIRVWATTYVNDLDSNVLDTKVNYGEHWRFKGLSYPIHLQEIDICTSIKLAEDEQKKAADYKQQLYTQLIELNTHARLISDRISNITNEITQICPSKNVKYISDWDLLHSLFIKLPVRIQQSRFIRLPFVRGMFKTIIETYAKALRMPIDTKEYTSWHNQIMKFRNMDIPSITGEALREDNLMRLLIENAVLSDKYTRLTIERNELEDQLDTLKQNAQLVELEYTDALSTIDNLREEHKSAVSRRSRLTMIKENSDLYKEAKARAVTVITSYIIQDYSRSLEWLINDGASELVSEIETLMLLSNKFDLLNHARMKLEQEIEAGENVASIQSALKEKDLLSTAMYLTGDSLSLNAQVIAA